MSIIATLRAHLGRRRSTAPRADLPASKPTSAELDRQWHKARGKARGGDRPWSAGTQDQGQPGRSWGGIGGDGGLGG